MEKDLEDRKASGVAESQKSYQALESQMNSRHQDQGFEKK